MFKALIIAYYYPPMGLSGVQRTLKFTKYLNHFNWEPVVLTSGNVSYFAHDVSLLNETKEAGIRIERVIGREVNSLLNKKGTVKMPPEYLRKLLSRISNTLFIPDNKISWSKKALEKGRELLKNEHFDLIFVSAPPFSSINTAVELKKEFNLPLVVDYRDLWYGNQFAFYPTPFHKQAHKNMEYSALKAADRIIVTNRRMKEKLLEYYKFLTFEDIFIISHGFDPADFNQIKIDKKANNKLRFGYSGIFYEFITPKFLLKAFKKLTIERPDVAANIELHFAGHLRKENNRLLRKLKLQEFVKVHGYLEHKNSLKKMMECDILWMMVGKGRNADTISSGKLFEYFGTRKPILACLPDGALKSAAESYEASFITDPDNIDQIKNAFLQIHQLYINKSLPNPNEEFVEKHRRDFLTEQLTKQFQLVVKEIV